MNDDEKKGLMAPIPISAISKREGAGGATLDYVTGEYVMRRMLEILGPDGWSSSFVVPPMVRHVGEVKNDKGVVTKVVVTADATMSITVAGPGGVSRSDVGVGVATARTVGEATEMALKTAATDAFKRAARQLGNAVGLALYDKEQRNVSLADEPAAKGRARGDTEASLVAAIDAASTAAEMADLQARIRKVSPKLGEEVTKALVARWRATNDRLTPPPAAPEGE